MLAKDDREIGMVVMTAGSIVIAAAALLHSCEANRLAADSARQAREANEIAKQANRIAAEALDKSTALAQESNKINADIRDSTKEATRVAHLALSATEEQAIAQKEQQRSRAAIPNIGNSDTLKPTGDCSEVSFVLTNMSDISQDVTPTVRVEGICVHRRGEEDDQECADELELDGLMIAKDDEYNGSFSLHETEPRAKHVQVSLFVDDEVIQHHCYRVARHGQGYEKEDCEGR